MLVGHYAPALVAHRLAPTAPLWILVLAAQVVDVGFMVLGLLGVEAAALSPDEPRLVVTSGVWTHSIPATIAWAMLSGAVAWLATRDRRASLAIGAVVASHFVTDLFVHVPDLPVGFEQAPAVGFGLWLYPPLAWGLECALVVVAGAWLAARSDARARRRLWALVGGLVVLQTLAEFVIPTPSSFLAFAGSALGTYAAVCVAARWVEG